MTFLQYIKEMYKSLFSLQVTGYFFAHVSLSAPFFT